MRIYSETGDFSPKNFKILRFYGETFLFAWHGEKLKVFPYGDSADGSNPRLLLAPGGVENVQSFGDRIFVTCSPCGVYKLSKNYQFALLSNSAIGIGAKFFQVFRLKDNYIFLGDCQARTSRPLLRYDPIDGATPCTVGLNGETVENELFTVLLENAVDQNELSIFVTGYEIYKITSDAVKIIHSSRCLITGIVEVKKSEKLTCLLYVTNKSTAILMYAEDGELVFEKILLNNAVKTACAFNDELLENIVWIVHSDGVKTHKTRKVLGKSSVDNTELKERNITCLRDYSSEILGLNSTGELVPVDLSMEETVVVTGDDDFVRMKREMLEGTDSIVEAICGQVEELQSLDVELLNLQGALRRINMAACKQDMPTAPKLKVKKIADRTIVNCKFGYGIPEQSQISVSLKSSGRKIFSMKQVTENESNVELPVPTSTFSEAADVTTDLITLADEDYSWCLVKNCIKDRGEGTIREEISSDNRISFVDSRLAALHHLKMEDRPDIDKLYAIKNSIRKEFNYI